MTAASTEVEVGEATLDVNLTYQNAIPGGLQARWVSPDPAVWVLVGDDQHVMWQ